MKTLERNPNMMTVIVNIQMMREVINNKRGSRYSKEEDFENLEKMTENELYEIQELLIPEYNKAVGQKSKVEELKELADYLTEEQAEFAYNFLKAAGNGELHKGTLMKMLDYTSGVDTALDVTIVRKVQQTYPEFQTRYMVTDHRESAFGMWKNVAEGIIDKFHEVFSR